MSDLDVATEAEGVAKPMRIRITKADAYVDIKTEDLPQAVYEEALMLGLEAMANRGMTKVVGLKDMEGEELAKARADAMKIAEKNVKAMLDGSIKLRGQSAKTKTSTPKAVMDEARRQAKIIVKAVLKEKGYKMKDVPAKEITAAANAYITANPAILIKAQAEVDRRNTAAGEVPSDESLNSILAGISAQPAPKVEKVLSAAQAGKTKKRKAKPQADATA